MVLSPKKANGFNWSIQNKNTQGGFEDELCKDLDDIWHQIPVRYIKLFVYLNL